ncbi:MAG: acyl-CoA carboxylase epsilon subunit [Acidimicrobiales bacterium]
MSRDPSPEELAAIVAAVEVLWPRAPVVAAVEPPSLRWRFSGRWWSRPTISRRDRPWVGPHG